MDKLIEQLLDAMEARKKTMTGVRGPQREKLASVEAILEEIKNLRGRPLFYPYIGAGIGNGALVGLADGSVKWDFITGIGTNFFGHCDRHLTRIALKAALSDVPIQGHLQPNIEYAHFLSSLSQIAPGRCKHVWPSMSGTMANENALKIIRQKKHPAYRVLAFAGAFAGRSTTLSEITDNPQNKKGQAILGQAFHLPFYDPENPRSIETTIQALTDAFRRHPGEWCAIHIELIQGEAGFRSAPREFFSAVMDRCREEGVAVWVDEIQTFGRTGDYFMVDRLELADRADVVTLGKMLCGSAVCFSSEYNPEPGLISGTFAGYTGGLALGPEIIRRLDAEGHLGPEGKTRQIEKGLISKLDAMRQKGLLNDYSVFGSMAALTPTRADLDSIRALVKRLFDLGLCAYYAGHGPYRLRLLLPAGCLAPADLDEPMSILEKGLQGA